MGRSSNKPRRYKTLDEYDFEDHLADTQHHGRGPRPRPETDEYKRARKQTVIDAGFEDEEGDE